MPDFLLAVGRIALVALFLNSAYGHVTGLAGFTSYLASKGVPQASIMAPLATLAEVVGALMVIVGFKTRYAAAMLIVFTAVALYLAHDFWNMTGPTRMQNTFHAWKNLSIIGGLLMLAGIGPGRFSIDERRG